jgi:hypothetical protein
LESIEQSAHMARLEPEASAADMKPTLALS